MKFLIRDRGDMSVGIFPFETEVEFKDDMVDGFWDENNISFIKDTLRELYDVIDGDVYTESEWEHIMREEDEMIKRIYGDE